MMHMMKIVMIRMTINGNDNIILIKKNGINNNNYYYYFFTVMFTEHSTDINPRKVKASFKQYKNYIPFLL